MLEKLEVVTSLVIGIILLIVGFFNQIPLWDLSVQLLIAMVVFYIIGLIVRKYLMKTVFNSKDKSQKPDEINEDKENNNEEGNETGQTDEEI